MGRKSEYPDKYQRDIVQLILDGHTYAGALGSIPINPLAYPSDRTIGRWIETWKPVIEAEILAEQIEADKKKQKEAEKGHNRHNSEKGRHKKKTIEIDLRDVKDGFVLWIKTLDSTKFTTPRNGTIKRIQNQNRYAFTHGTIDLLTQYLKFKKLKVIK